MRITIANQSSVPVDEKRIGSLVGKVLSGEGFGEAEISVALVEEDEIRSLNAKYRKKDEVTDVLAFPHDGVGLEGTGILFIGEVVICPSRVDDQAEVSFIDEMDRVLIHGTLHLLGFDHEKLESEGLRMREKEEFYLRLEP